MKVIAITIVTLSDFVFQSQMQFSVDNIIIQEQNSAIWNGLSEHSDSVSTSGTHVVCISQEIHTEREPTTAAVCNQKSRQTL